MEIMAEITAAARLPFYQSRESLEQIAQEASGHLSPITREIVQSQALTIAPRAEARYEAEMDLMALGLSIEQYQTEYGQLPGTLDEVAGILGREVPLDPFTGESYRYIPSANGFQLYSVGQNLQDDGGRHHPGDGDLVWRFDKAAPSPQKKCLQVARQF